MLIIVVTNGILYLDPFIFWSLLTQILNINFSATVSPDLSWRFTKQQDKEFLPLVGYLALKRLHEKELATWLAGMNYIAGPITG